MAVLTVLLLTATVLVAIPAIAQPDESGRLGVETEGFVEGGAAEAYIVCKWELPNHKPGGMVFGGDYGRYYDGAGYPCYWDGHPGYSEGHTVLAVEAPPHDLYDPEIPYLPIELWSAVTHPAGLDAISDVYWKIFHPDGSFKWQDHGEAIDPNYADEELGAYWDGENYQIAKDESSMWFAASYGTHQLEERAIEDGTSGLVALTLQRRVDLYRGWFPLHKDQPCGHYAVENHVVANGVDTYITNYIYVHCFVDLQLDFDHINWGLLTPGNSKVLNGNLRWGDYGPDGAFGSYNMTVGNGGSGEMQVGVAFAPLVQVDTPGPKLITEFDAAFGITPSDLQWIDPIYSGDEPQVLGDIAWFNHDYYRTLCANETGKLDLSVHPPSSIPNGGYYGGLVVYGMGTYANNGDVVETTTTEPPNDRGICNNTNGIWDDGNQRPPRP
jgi:hypothetical protein